MLANVLVIFKWDGWSSLCHRNACLPSIVSRGVGHLLIVLPEDKKHLRNKITLWLHCQLLQQSRSIVQDSLSFRTKTKIFKRKCVYIHILDNYKNAEFIMNWHKNIRQIVVTKLWIWFNYRKFREKISFLLSVWHSQNIFLVLLRSRECQNHMYAVIYIVLVCFNMIHY